MRIFRGRAFQAAVKAKTQAWKQSQLGLFKEQQEIQFVWGKAELIGSEV